MKGETEEINGSYQREGELCVGVLCKCLVRACFTTLARQKKCEHMTFDLTSRSTT